MSGGFAVRRITYEGSIMVNICDEELMGRSIREGELEVSITKSYFGEEIVGEDGAVALLRSCSIANLVGERIVKRALEMKLASGLSVRRISGVPFLMIYKFRHG